MAESSPSVIILAGPNGSGKTTAARTYLAENLKVLTYVNADVIAQGLAGFAPETAAVRAGRIMLETLHELAAERVNFAFETTLAGRAYVPWLRNLKNTGYSVHLTYFWLGSADLAVARVAERVRAGGHSIPEPTIRQRYVRSMQNFFRLYRPLADTWAMYNNSRPNVAELVAFREWDRPEMVLLADTWKQIQKAHCHGSAKSDL